MPNYVKNIVFFKGKKEALDKMVEYLKQGGRTELDFNLFVPEPEDVTTSLAPAEETVIAVGEYMTTGTFECLGLPSAMYGTARKEMESDLGHAYTDDKQLVKDYMIYLLKKPYLDYDYWTRCQKWFRNLNNYGHADGYSWRCEKWGTKWNACEPDSLDVLIPLALEKEEKDPYSIMTYTFETAWSMPDGIYKAISAKFPDITVEVKYADEDMGHNCGHVAYRAGEMIKFTIYDGNSKESYEFALSVWDEEYLLDYLKQDEDGNWYIDIDAYEESEET